MLKKYLALLHRSLGAMLEYRVGILIWMLVNVMPLVMLAVWYSLSEGGPIAGYTQNDFVSYYLLLTLMRQLTNVWVIWELDYEIRHGDLSIKLLQPINPIHSYMASHLADKVFRFIVMIPLALVAWWIFPTIHYDLTPITFALMLVAAVVSFLIRFFIQYTIGLLAFWVSESITLNEIIFALSMMLGGIIAPIDLFPSQVVAIAKYLPFRYMMGFPVEVVMGRLSSWELVSSTLVMFSWLALALVVYFWLWRKGIKQFSAYGA
jgi:ABC-2 type transport system permease protein